MRTVLLLLALASLPVFAAAPRQAPGRAAPSGAAVDSATLEKELQRLPWTQFKAVVESVPKLKAGVDAYGPLGWQFVQANYSRYGWKKNIDKLDERQKQQLAEQIRRVKGQP